MKLITLTARKEKEISGPYKGFFKTLLFRDGILVATVPAHCRQPKKGTPTMVLNCFRWNIIWE